MTLLEDFSNLLKNSVIQCFTASDVGIPMECLSLLNENSDLKEFQLLISVFEQIVVYACNRPIFYRFMQILMGANNFNFLMDMLNVLMRLIDTNKPSFPMLQMQKLNHFIKLQNIPFKFLKEGMSFQIRILFSNFLPQNNLVLLYYKSITQTKKYFSVTMTVNDITIDSVFIDKPITKSFSSPLIQNIWMNMFMIINMDEFLLFIDGELVCRISYIFDKTNSANEMIGEMFVLRRFLSKDCDEIVYNQFNQLVIQSPVSENIENISKIVEKTELAKMPNTLMIYSASYQKDELMMNLMHNQYPEATFSSYYYPSVSPFFQIFWHQKV